MFQDQSRSWDHHTVIIFDIILEKESQDIGSGKKGMFDFLGTLWPEGGVLIAWHLSWN